MDNNRQKNVESSEVELETVKLIKMEISDIVLDGMDTAKTNLLSVSKSTEMGEKYFDTVDDHEVESNESGHINEGNERNNERGTSAESKVESEFERGIMLRNGKALVPYEEMNSNDDISSLTSQIEGAQDNIAGWGDNRSDWSVLNSEGWDNTIGPLEYMNESDFECFGRRCEPKVTSDSVSDQKNKYMNMNIIHLKTENIMVSPKNIRKKSLRRTTRRTSSEVNLEKEKINETLGLKNDRIESVCKVTSEERTTEILQDAMKIRGPLVVDTELVQTVVYTENTNGDILNSFSVKEQSCVSKVLLKDNAKEIKKIMSHENSMFGKGSEVSEIDSLDEMIAEKEESENADRFYNATFWVRKIFGIQYTKYLEATGAIIGDKNVLFFNADDRAKIEITVSRPDLNDIIVDRGLEIDGEWLKAYRMSEMPVLITLSGVPPFIPHSSLVKGISKWGTCKTNDFDFFKAPVEKMSLKHIQTHRRKVWVKVRESEIIPDTIKIRYGGKYYEVSVFNGESKCFKCGKSGHIQRNCRETPYHSKIEKNKQYDMFKGSATQFEKSRVNLPYSRVQSNRTFSSVVGEGVQKSGTPSSKPLELERSPIPHFSGDVQRFKEGRNKKIQNSTEIHPKAKEKESLRNNENKVKGKQKQEWVTLPKPPEKVKEKIRTEWSYIEDDYEENRIEEKNVRVNNNRIRMAEENAKEGGKMIGVYLDAKAEKEQKGNYPETVLENLDVKKYIDFTEAESKFLVQEGLLPEMKIFLGEAANFQRMEWGENRVGVKRAAPSSDEMSGPASALPHRSEGQKVAKNKRRI